MNWKTAIPSDNRVQGLDRFARLDKANDLLVFFAAKLTEAQKAPALYKVEELVTECLFAGNTCDG